MCLSSPHLSQSLYTQTARVLEIRWQGDATWKKQTNNQTPRHYCIDVHNSSPENEEAEKSNLGVSPAISVALQQFVLTEELRQMKLHSVLSLYWSFQWEKQNILEALTLYEHERLTCKKSGHIMRDRMKGKETFLAKVVICSRSRKQSKIT